MNVDRDIRYADNNGVQIAYQVLGDGPLDIIVVFEWASHIDLAWEHPRSQRFLRRLAELGRVITIDLRGSGLSDRIDALPAVEEWVEDIRVVMDDVGSTRAALIGSGHSSQLCMMFAAVHPDRTAALITVNGYARLGRADGYEWGIPASVQERILKHTRERWGDGRTLSAATPGLAEGPRGLEFAARLERATCSPARAVDKQRIVFDVDVRDVLATIAVPTLVLSTAASEWTPRQARYLVERIPGARHIELPGAGLVPMMAEDGEPLLESIGAFVAGAGTGAVTGRSLMSIAFTDIVGSTEMAAEVGDRRWRSLMELHESVSSQEVTGAGGRVVKFTGDGMLATFDGPARAVQCLKSLGAVLSDLGLPIRAGVHTGEVELIAGDIAGLAVNIAARISALATAGEILTSSTVRDLVAGSGLEFDDRGEHELKGVPGTWRVLAAR